MKQMNSTRTVIKINRKSYISSYNDAISMLLNAPLEKRAEYRANFVVWHIFSVINALSLGMKQLSAAPAVLKNARCSVLYSLSIMIIGHT